MKLSAFILLMTSLQISAKTFSQDVTISGKNLSCEQVFNKIKKQTGYDFVYNPALLKDVAPVNLNVRNAPFTEVLDECLKGHPLMYEVKYDIIVIKERAVVVNNSLQNIPPPPPPLPKIIGVVKDEQGTPMEGASIVLKGTDKVAVANRAGSFTLNDITPGNYTVEISYIGYKTKSISVKVNNSTVSLNIVLIKEVKVLEETVVVGYGVQKKVNLTGSVATVKGEEMASRPIANAVTGLQGLLPGVEISSSTGQPGSAGTNIRIRGVNTLYSSNSPLILIDGAEGDLTMLNPDDIESVSVLKDAASSAIYGARAATGVLLVTTKKGANKKMSVNYSGYASIQKPTSLPQLVNGREYMTLYNEALTNAGLAKLFLDSAFIKYDNKSDLNDYSNTNWINEVYKKHSFQQSHNLSLDGGNGKTGYHISYGYLNQGGLVVGDPYSSYRHNFRLRANTEAFNCLNLDASINYSYYYRQDAAASGTAGVFRLAQRISPLLPVKWMSQNTDGSWSPTQYYSIGSVSNPVNAAYNSGYYHYTSNIPTVNLSASLTIIKGLQLKSQYVFTGTFGQSKTYSKIINRYNADGTEWAADSSLKNSISSSFSNEYYQNYSNTLNYEKSFGKHNITALAGYSQEWDKTYSESAYRQSILLDGIEVISGGTTNIQNSGTETHWALQSYFGRINYNYEEKYLLEANIRRDGTSRFSKAHRWGTFPSFSAGWNILKEDFMAFAKPVFQQLKIRGSYGTLGNQNVGSDLYPYLTPITSYSNAYPIGYTNNVGYYQSSIGNADLHWETVEMTNLGIDAQLLRNRLAVNFDWFVKNNKDALVKPTYPSTIGSTSSSVLPYANMGRVQSKGWELVLNWRDNIGKVNYSIGVMVSRAVNTVKSLGTMAPVIGDNIFRVGDPVNAYYGYKTDGLAQASDFANYNSTTGKYSNPSFAINSSYAAIIQPGDIKYHDLNKNGTITPDSDRTVIGNPYPEYSYSIRGDVSWKNFDLSFLLQGVAKVNGYLYDEAIHAFINDYSIPQKAHLNRWTPTHTNAWYPRLYYAETHNSLFSDYWIQNAAYLRMKNLQIGYTFHKKLSATTNIEKLRIYFSAENLFTITKFFKAYDPEVRTITSSSYPYPQVKTFAVGVNLTLR